MTRILTARDIAALLTIDDCIDLVADVFRRFADGLVAKSETLGVRAGQGTFHVKAAAAEVFAVKVNANFPANPARHGLPTIQGAILINDLERGALLGVLDSGAITALRTAAAATVAAKFLAREGARTIAIVGFGVQGRATLEAMKRVRDFAQVRVFDVNPRAGGAFACRSIDEAVDGADVIVTCTPSHEPVLHARHARPGLFIAALGADNPQKNEIAPELLALARVVPDLVEQAASMGDLHHAIAAGAMSAGDVHGDLGQVIAGRVAARRSDEEFFIFDSTGTALQDVVVGALALERAAVRRIGIEVDLT